MKNKIVIAVAAFISACFLQSCGNKNNRTAKNEMDSSMSSMAQDPSKSSAEMQMDNSMMQSMSSTTGKMNDMKMTGDFDLDFANMMILHHQAAINMGEVEIAKGTDAQIRTMAKNIVTAQNAEIGQLHAFIENYKKPEAEKKTAEMHDELSETMKAMMDTMNKIKMTGNTDIDFVMMMVPHHESAVTMAKDELTHGKQPGLKRMAEKMIADQSKEIGEFKAWSSNQE